MEIFVCVKQVPEGRSVQVDEATGVLRREGAGAKMNPYDLFALEVALRLREDLGGRVTVGTMGPPMAEAVILEAYMMGADEGYVFSDVRFAGADVLATSYTLSQAIRSISDFDLIVCGRQTTDGDTAQVGPAVAEHMQIPHAAWVSKIEPAPGGVVVEQQLQSVVETVFLPFPCLVTVEQDIAQPRLPSLVRARQTAGKQVHVLDLSWFFDQDSDHYGLSGSPTQVERIFPPPAEPPREMWRGEDSAQRLYEYLTRHKFV